MAVGDDRVVGKRGADSLGLREGSDMGWGGRGDDFLLARDVAGS